MVGQVLGAVGALPEIFTELEISYFLLRRLLGVRTEGDKKAAKVRPAGVDFVIPINVFAPEVGETERAPPSRRWNEVKHIKTYQQFQDFCVPAGPEVIQERGADG